MRIIVIGCGISGLTTGLCLIRDGHHVSIWAESLPPHTTSNIAVAHWFPYLAEPAQKVNIWASRTYHYFKEVIATSATRETGVFMAQMLHLEAKASDNPGWASDVDGFRKVDTAEIPAGYQEGYVFNTPVIDTSIYLGYLQRKFLHAGGIIRQIRVNDLSEVLEQADVIANCSGLGSRHLVNDHSIYPVRGQLVHIKHNNYNKIVSAEGGPHGLAYIVPRVNEIVLGGTSTQFDENLNINVEDTKSIIQRCQDLVPELGKIQESDIIKVSCGLRPVRPEVRVEMEEIKPDKFVLHNYGHGGAGVTLSWGCAEEIVALLHKIEDSRAV
jgi:D-amino-acid oxidase